MTKKVAAYSEILYHLINFRTEQFQQLKKMVGIDYDSFMILSVMGARLPARLDRRCLPPATGQSQAHPQERLT